MDKAKGENPIQDKLDDVAWYSKRYASEFGNLWGHKTESIISTHLNQLVAAYVHIPYMPAPVFIPPIVIDQYGWRADLPPNTVGEGQGIIGFPNAADVLDVGKRRYITAHELTHAWNFGLKKKIAGIVSDVDILEKARSKYSSLDEHITEWIACIIRKQPCPEIWSFGVNLVDELAGQISKEKLVLGAHYAPEIIDGELKVKSNTTLEQFNDYFNASLSQHLKSINYKPANPLRNLFR